MTFLKRFVSTVISAAALVTALVLPASASENVMAEPYTLTGEQLIDRIEDTFDDARRLAGRWSFVGKCSTLVNCSTIALGIQNVRFDGDGRDEYNLYDSVQRTDGGYDVVRYHASEYDLLGALNAVCENGQRDVYNLIVCFQGGRTASSSTYGHALFVHGIVDGMVYFSESYSLYLAGQYHREGTPIVCTVAEFAEYYNKWAYFEGVIHLDFPDETAPALTRMSVVDSSEEGFSLSCKATDNIGIVEMYAKVWPYGTSEEDAKVIPVNTANDAASLRVDTAAFDGFAGRYYVNIYAVDRKGNVSMISAYEDGVSLYQADYAEGTYRVKGRSAGLYNAPYERVNNTSTRTGVLMGGHKVEIVGSFVNELGETWYQLTDGNWLNAESVRPVYTLTLIWDMVCDLVRDSNT